MNHYDDPAEAKKKWEDRVKRINFDNLFIMMSTVSEAWAKAFSMLPFKKKICFTPFPSDLPSVEYARPYGDWNKQRDLPYWQTITGMAKGRYPLYDVYELLMNGNIRYRIQ